MKNMSKIEKKIEKSTCFREHKMMGKKNVTQNVYRKKKKPVSLRPKEVNGSKIGSLDLISSFCGLLLKHELFESIFH